MGLKLIQMKLEGFTLIESIHISSAYLRTVIWLLLFARGIVISIVPGILMTANSNSVSGLEVIIKGHNIFLAAHSYSLPIGTLADINALSFKVHCLCVL